MLTRTRYFLVGATFGALAATVVTPVVALTVAVIIPDEDYDMFGKIMRNLRNSIES